LTLLSFWVITHSVKLIYCIHSCEFCPSSKLLVVWLVSLWSIIQCRDSAATGSISSCRSARQLASYSWDVFPRQKNYGNMQNSHNITISRLKLSLCKAISQYSDTTHEKKHKHRKFIVRKCCLTLPSPSCPLPQALSKSQLPLGGQAYGKGDFGRRVPRWHQNIHHT